MAGYSKYRELLNSKAENMGLKIHEAHGYFIGRDHGNNPNLESGVFCKTLDDVDLKIRCLGANGVEEFGDHLPDLRG